MNDYLERLQSIGDKLKKIGEQAINDFLDTVEGALDDILENGDDKSE